MSNYSPSNGAQAFTSFAPSSDLYSMLMKELKMDGNELRKLLQTPTGSDFKLNRKIKQKKLFDIICNEYTIENDGNIK